MTAKPEMDLKGKSTDELVLIIRDLERTCNEQDQRAKEWMAEQLEEQAKAFDLGCKLTEESVSWYEADLNDDEAGRIYKIRFFAVENPYRKGGQ